MAGDGYPIFTVPRNLLLNLTTYVLPATAGATPVYQAHDSYAFSSDVNVYWLYNTSSQTDYKWWNRLDFNSQADNYQIYSFKLDDLECPDGEWDQTKYWNSVEDLVTKWFSNSTYLGVKRVTWEGPADERSLHVRQLANYPWKGYEIWYTQDSNHTVQYMIPGG